MLFYNYSTDAEYTFQDVLPFPIINVFSVHVSKNINKLKKDLVLFSKITGYMIQRHKTVRVRR